MSQGYNNWGYNCDCQNEKKEYLPKHCECCSCKCHEKKEEPKQKCATIKICAQEEKKEDKKDDYCC